MNQKNIQIENSSVPKPVLLIVLDGWGYREASEYNAIVSAKKPTWDNLWRTCPHTLISGSGHAVGLPQDQMGNSEVGHLTMGAGRTVYQEFTRIDKAIEEGFFFQNQTLLTAIEKVRRNRSALHIFGLLSPGGVHSHERHIQAMVELAAREDLKKIYIHAFLDGRDTPPKSALQSLKKLERQLQNLNHGQIASIIGRYYAMDRDNRWDRIEQAYRLLTEGSAAYTASSATKGLQMAYERGETDEFVQATTIHRPDQNPIKVSEGDVVIFMNYRADRARELTRAFVEPKFSGFKRRIVPKLAEFVTLTQYAKEIKASVVFPPQALVNVLGAYVADQGLTQLRIAETEKYAHVTFFFNGGIEQPFPLEERILIPSKKVATYDLAPEMSALEVTDQLVQAIENKKYNLIICNFANPDMVGHTGNFAATVKAIEVIDDCLAKIIAALEKVGGEAIITADHGNAEIMYDDKTQQAHTAHTSEPVPVIYFGRKAKITHDGIGTLADIAPTLLYLMNLPKPAEMTGESLISFDK